MDLEEMTIIFSAIKLLEDAVEKQNRSYIGDTLTDSAKQILRSYMDDKTISMIAHNNGQISMRGLPENFMEEE
jgi:hypothetical protein